MIFPLSSLQEEQLLSGATTKRRMSGANKNNNINSKNNDNNNNTFTTESTNEIGVGRGCEVINQIREVNRADQSIKVERKIFSLLLLSSFG